MAKVKQSVIETIYKTLDNRYFTPADFDINFESKEEIVVIRFKHRKNFYFAIKEQFVRPGGIAAIASLDGKLVPATFEAPGDFKAEESHQFDSFEACINRIPKWCKNIYEDLRSKSPLADEFDELLQKFEDHINDHLAEPESHFSVDEIEVLQEKFEDLYRQFQDLSEKHLITEETLNEIKSEFETIKQSAHDLNKGLWANLTKNKMIRVIKKIGASKEARTLMFEGAKRLLGLETPPAT